MQKTNAAPTAVGSGASKAVQPMQRYNRDHNLCPVCVQNASECEQLFACTTGEALRWSCVHWVGNSSITRDEGLAT